MPAVVGSRALDAWARHLGVTTDDDAAAVLRGVAARLDDLATDVAFGAHALKDGPDPELDGLLLSGWGSLLDASTLALEVAAAFDRHERGGDR